jgi:hypothetical protein
MKLKIEKIIKDEQILKITKEYENKLKLENERNKEQLKCKNEEINKLKQKNKKQKRSKNEEIVKLKNEKKEQLKSKNEEIDELKKEIEIKKKKYKKYKVNI